MPQQVKAFGQILQFPDGMSEDEMAAAIRANEADLNPDYKAPLKGTLNSLAKKHLGVDFTSTPSIADQAEASATEGENTAARQVPGAPVRQSTYNKALLDPQQSTGGTDIASRIADAAGNDFKGQANQQELELLRTEALKPSESGFVSSALNSAGRTIKGAGQIGSDFLNADKDNAITQYGQKLLDDNPVWAKSLGDIRDEPFVAFKEASGNSVPSMGAMVAVGTLGAGITSLAPLTGPAAPVVAAVGTAVQWLGPAAVAALPSYSGIRDAQILKDPKNEADAKSKAIAALGASAVGAIEVAFGPQQWAIAMLTKEGRSAMARKFASTSVGEAAIKGALKGGFVEGAEEVVQSPIEQLASYENPTTNESIQDTLFSGAMGFLGGTGPGAVTGAVSQVKFKSIADAPTVDDAIKAATESVIQPVDPTLEDIKTTVDARQPQAAEVLDIVLPDNSSVKAQWAVVDADRLAASIKEDVNQPRDRTRAASDVQIKSIANAPDYRRLSDSPVMDVGAPVVDQDGRIVAGNGRFAGLSQAYEQGTATEYLNQLREDAASKGLSIEGIAKPVLIRQLVEPVDTRRLAIASNSGTTLQMSALEQAKLDSERMKGIENLDVNDLGDIALTPRNMTQLKDSLGTYTGAELGSLVDKGGQLSQEGMRRVRNAMLAKAYGSSPVLERLVESTDSDMRNVLGALTKSANHIIKTKGDVKPLMEAVDTYAQLKATGQPVDNFLAQQDAFSDGLSREAEDILRFIDTNVRSQKKLTDFIKGNFREVDTTSADMFGAPARHPNAKAASKDASWVIKNKDTGEILFETFDKAKVDALNTSKYEAVPIYEYLTGLNNVNQLEKYLKDSGYAFTVEPASVRDVDALDSAKKARKEHAEKVAKFFKKKVVFVKADGPFRINGVMVPNITDTIFIDIRTDKPFDVIMAHELSHWMEQEKPAVYKQMVKSLKKVINEGATGKYAKKYGIDGATDAELTKEIVGDIMGDNFTQQSFWDKVAAANPEAFRDIAAAIIKWLKGVIVKAKANGMGSEEWVKDAVKAQEIVAKAVAQYTETEAVAGSKEGGVKFNVTGDNKSDIDNAKAILSQLSDLRAKLKDDLDIETFREFGKKSVEAKEVLAEMLESGRLNGIGAEGKWLISRNTTSSNPWRVTDFGVKDGQPFSHTEYKTAKQALSDNNLVIDKSKIALFSRAYHGSPHDHKRFDKSKIGTGEGAQAYGYGHYFAESKDVAEWYRKSLANENSLIYPDGSPVNVRTGGSPEGFAQVILSSNKGDYKRTRFEILGYKSDNEDANMFYDAAIDKLNEYQDAGVAVSGKNGKLYEVELAPEQDEYLLWDKPLSEQSDKVKRVLQNELRKHITAVSTQDNFMDVMYDGEVLGSFEEHKVPTVVQNVANYIPFLGEDLYKDYAKKLNSDKQASEYLHSLGIRGIKYLDGSSRAKGEGAYNYVIFDDNDISITAKFSKAAVDSEESRLAKKYYSPLRRWMPIPRSPGWTKEKIIRALKSRAWSRAFGKSTVLKEIAKFDSAEEFADHIYYHGTGSSVSRSLVPSITMSQAEAERSGGGGYGERYWAISLTKSKEIASNFTAQSNYGTVYGVILKKGANVQTIPGIEDAVEIEDHVVQLWNDGVDAVDIGGGEQELAVLNPAAIVRYENGEIFGVFKKKKFEPLTTEQIKGIYAKSKEFVAKLQETPAAERKNLEVPEVKFSKAEVENTLIAQHNLSVRNLIHADRMGGLAAPSIAVTDKAHPLTGFGEITLLSDKDLIDPARGTKIFGSDIYSPRYPSISYDFSGKPIKALNAILADGAAATGDSSYYNDNLQNDPFRELLHSSAAMYTFLAEQGKEPNIKYTEIKELSIESLKPFADGTLDSFDMSKDEGFKEAIRGYWAEKFDREKLDEDQLRNLARSYANDVVAYRDSKRNVGKVDRQATNSALFRQILDSDLRNKFDTYLVDLVNRVEPKERIFKGYTYSGNRQYLPHDIDTVIKMLKKDLRGGENFKYGLGSIRAKYSPQFKSIEHIRKSKGMLMDSASFDQVKKEVQAELDELNEALASYGTFSGYDNVETMLSDAAKRGISGALKDNGFENVPDDIKVDIQTFLNKLKNMPTEYFEAKILRAVGLGEFSTAIIPDDSPPQVEAILKKNGVEDIRKYKSGDNEDRVRQINNVTHVMFSRAPKLYSKLEQALEAANDKVFSTGPQVKLWLQSNAAKLGIKKDEIYWSGIDNWLDAQGKVSKQQVVEFVRQNGVKVEDVTLKTEPSKIRELDDERTFYEQSDDGKWYVYGYAANENDVYDTEAEAAAKVAEYNKDLSDGATKHNNSQLTLPGGTDYKELVVTVPTVEKYNESDTTHFGDTGQGKHIGWIRMNTRNGGLFIEELQSQRAQQGRSKGFGARNVTRYEVLLDGNYWGDFNTKVEAEKAVKDAVNNNGTFEIKEVVTGRLRGVPPAPFVSDANSKATNAYITLLMKKALIEAVSNDHTSVSWTTGDQQADRYDLSKQIDSLRIRKQKDGGWGVDAYRGGDNVISQSNLSDGDLSNTIGKDLAKKAMLDMTEPGIKEYSNVDLKVGGEWAQSMYGNEQGLNLQGKPSLMTQAANDIFKHVGSGKVESINGQPGFYITPEMKSKDLPLFSRATITVDGIERPTTNSEGKPINNPVNFWRWFGDDANVDDQGRPKVLYHSTLEDVSEFSPTGKFMGYSGTSGISLTDNKDMASRYLDRFGERRYDGVMFQKNVMPVYAKIGKYIERNEPFETDVRFGAPLPENYVPTHVKLGYDTVIRDDSINRKGATVKHSDARNALRGKEYIVSNPNQIKSAIGNNGDYSSTNNDIRFSFAGPKAETADKYALETAQQRIAAGDDADTVRQDTGWFKGVDGKWRFEINDSDASIKKPFPTKGQLWGDIYKSVYAKRVGITLGDILDHPKLFAAYPRLADLSVGTQKGSGASFRVSTALSPSMIEIGENMPMYEVLSALLHEIQHGIQRIEGFATGGSVNDKSLPTWKDIAQKINDRYAQRKKELQSSSEYKQRVNEITSSKELPLNRNGEPSLALAQRDAEIIADKEFGVDALEEARQNEIDTFLSRNRDANTMNPRYAGYERLAGEVEARNTQRRQAMTDDERRLTSPSVTQDVPDRDQIIVYNGVEMRSEPLPPPPAETRLRRFQRMNQDSFNRFTVIKEWMGDKLSDKADVYAAEERYHSMAANKLEDFREQQRNPLIEKIQKAGYTLGDIEVFLKMQHAQEANAQIRKLGGDTAYGITDDDAADYLAEAPKDLAKLANEFRDITEQTKKLRLDTGILNTDITDAWEGAYQYYIPVKGEADATRGVGKGLKTNFKSKRRLGHSLRDEHVIENILLDHERAILEVERNRVGKHLVMMAAEMQRPDILSIDQPEKRKVLKTDTAYTVEANGVVQGVFKSREEAKMFKQLYATSMPNVAPSAIVISQTKDQRVIASASPMLADNEINVYMDGHVIRVQINDELLARAYTKLGVEQFSDIVAAGRILNGYLSKVYTGYNPEFILTNMIRDFSSGTINLTGEQGFGMATKALTNYPRMFGDLLKYAATNGKQSTKWIDSYRANGGNTGAAYLSDMERLGNEVSTEYASYQGVMANIKQGDTANAARAAGRKVFNATLKWIYNLNQAGENAMRLAAFKAMIDSGRTVNEAAKVAKNITVNFNRKGERQWAPALYLFYNASIQGTAATAHALTKGKHRGQAWALAGSMAAVGYLVASAFGGGSEDDWDDINEYAKERNMLIKSGDGYVKVPVPYGYGFFWNLGRHMAEAQRTGEWGKTPWQLATSAIEELTPFSDVVAGGQEEFRSDQVFMGFMPTAMKIAAQPIFNKQLFSGNELMPESQFDKSQPDRQKMFRTTKGTMYDEVAGRLEHAGFDVSPETLKYITRTATGGAGSLVDTAISAAMLKSEGAELDTQEIPFVRKGYMELGIKDKRAAYYKAREEARTAAEEFNRARRANDIGKMRAVVEDKRELLALDRYANKLAAAIDAARDQQDAVRADENLSVKEKRLKLKDMESQEAKFYDQYLDVFKAFKLK